MKIFKYPLELVERQDIQIDPLAKYLTVQFQGSQLCLWALVADPINTQPRTIAIVGTGHEFHPNGFQYIGTVQEGLFVWHVWGEPR